uniref:Uncharacterized protein n=1 Tax=Meloidogyne enterolobii TaxID=390850 RepID=A0A6V7VF87_MELEN|nr:unnamed protein product [Meloidogyne enterolobii]
MFILKFLAIEFLLPIVPKNIKEMKIARYFFEQLFTCAFKDANFYNVIFNPQMLELLFDDNKARIPLTVHSHESRLIKFLDTYISLKFVLNHMRSYHFISNFGATNDDNDQTIEILFNILKNGGNIFYRISYDNRHSLKLYNLIIKHIETSQNLSKMVKELNLSFTREPIISKTAENIEINVGGNNLKTTKYQLSNKHNPEIKFSVSVREVGFRELGNTRFDVNFKRIA